MIYAVVLLCAAVYASGPAQLTDANFDDFIKENDKVLVEFYAPWCGHCKNLEPKYHAAAEEINDNDDIPAKLAQVDATAVNFAGDYGVEGYPTMLWFENGDHEKYSGPRETDGIVKWVKSHSLPAFNVIKGKEAATFGASFDYVLIGYMKAGTKKEAAFEKAATRIQRTFEGYGDLDITIGKVTLKKGATRFVFRRNNFQEIDGPAELAYKGKVSGLEDFVDQNMWPLVSPIGISSAVFMNPKAEAVLFIYADPETEDGRKFLDEDSELLTVAKQLREEGIRTAWLQDSEKSIHSLDTKPTYMYAIKNPDSKGKMPFNKYILVPEEEAETSIAEFIAEAKAGTRSRHFKTEDVPEQKGPIMELVGSTFEDQVYDTETDTLVEFYAPWCGHCKNYVPKYEKLARYVNRYYKGKITIAKINGADNEVDAPVSGFPTIVFYPGGASAEKKEFVKFEGNRDDQDEVIDFLEEYAASLNDDSKQEL